tara:strand:+ start:846 stop:1604 length:759 start_codon:yes stop_codon:yes gene_type:complete
MKSPLKSNIHFNSFKKLNDIINNKSKISTFFLKDAGLELALANSGHLIIAHTNRLPIYEFWSAALQEAPNLARGVEAILPIMDDEQFSVFQETWYLNSKKHSRNVLFYILNNCSEDGYASSGKMNKSLLTPFVISRLKKFKIENFYPYYDQCESQIEAIDTAKKTDYILLPIGKYSLNLFEAGKNKGADMYTFNHKEIHARVNALDKKCILLYKSHPALYNLYKSFNIEMVDKYGRPADNKESCEELIITNF